MQNAPQKAKKPATTQIHPNPIRHAKKAAAIAISRKIIPLMNRERFPRALILQVNAITWHHLTTCLTVEGKPEGGGGVQRRRFLH
jgi:hypothetical protein